MHPRSKSLVIILALSMTATLTACQTGQKYSNPKTERIQHAEPPEMISSGIKADYRIADELNKIPGIQGAAVLIRDSKAYVGTHVIGQEKNPDSYMKKKNYQSDATNGPRTAGVQQQTKQSVDPSTHSGDDIPDAIIQDAGTSKEKSFENLNKSPNTTQNGVNQYGQNMQENRDQAGKSAVPGKAATATGNIDPDLLKQIEQKVKSMDPSIQQVYITGNNENVGQLQGYARYIQDGGSMERFMQDFEQTMQRIFPDKK